MKFLFYYYKFAPTHPRFKTQGVSFRSHADDLIKGLRQLGHQVEHLPYLDTSDAEKVKFYQTFRPDVVVSIESWRSFLSTIAHPLRYGIPAIPFFVSDGWIHPDYRDLLNELPLIVVPSQWVKKVYRRDGITNPKIEVVKESVDTSLFAPATDKQQVLNWRRNHGIKDQEIMILLVGGEIKSKGGYEVIEAIKRIGRKDIKLVAKTNPENPAAQNDLQFIQESGIADQILYLREMMTIEEVIILYQACDIYAAPSRNEGFGRPHIEAQACGKPVITINASAAKENVLHLKTGYVTRIGETLTTSQDYLYDEIRQVTLTMDFNPAVAMAYLPDIADLMKGILLLLDPGKRRELGEAARCYVVNNLDTLVIAKEFEKVVKKYCQK